MPDAAIGLSAKAKFQALLWLIKPALWEHKGRNLAAILAVTAGIALALAIHLVNQTAIGEFRSALQRINGAAQMQIKGKLSSFDESIYEKISQLPGIAYASPILEFDANDNTGSDLATIRTKRFKIMGVDPLQAMQVTPNLVAQSNGTQALFELNNIFVSKELPSTPTITLIGPHGPITFKVGGTTHLPDTQILVMDIANAQYHFNLIGRLSRIDLVLNDGVDLQSMLKQVAAILPDDVQVVLPQDQQERMSNLSRAYRVNLTVLALVALVTGGFIVFSSLAAIVLRQWSQLALISLLGASRRWLMASVLVQGLVLAGIGTVLGIGLGWALAAALLQWVGTDLGGGYFGNQRAWPSLNVLEAMGFVLLGLATGAAAAWLPARRALLARSADALKPGHGELASTIGASYWPALILGLAGALLLLLDPISSLPLPSYAAIACWLFAGVAAIPWVLSKGLSLMARRLGSRLWSHAPTWLAVHRAGQSPGLIITTVAAVVASMALVSAMAIMVTSFRGSVNQWLDQVLPADYYARMRGGTFLSNSGALSKDDQVKIAQTPIASRVEFLQSLELSLDAQRAPVVILVRTIDANHPIRVLPLTGAVSRAPQGTIPIYVSEAMVSLYDMKLGSTVGLAALINDTKQAQQKFYVAAVWRDYSRQGGAIQINTADFESLGNVSNASDLSIWLKPNISNEQVQAALSKINLNGRALEWRSARDIRALSLTIFDRSFAITYVLEAVAILVALIGVAASFSAQAITRQKEFAVLQHMGARNSLIGTQLALEAFVLTLGACIWGIAVGGLISLVLVHKVNPESFHWTMDVQVPWLQLAGGVFILSICAALCAAWAGKSALQGGALNTVRQDW
jgi:putative ABC transport system permease protein